MGYKTIQQMPVSTLDTPVNNDTLILFQSIGEQHKTRNAKELLKLAFKAGYEHAICHERPAPNFEDWIKTIRL